MVRTPPAAARGCEFWQPSRIPSWPERFSTPSACHPGLLPWLRLAATHTPNSPNSDGAPAAFAKVCFQAGWFRPCSTIAPFKSLCSPDNCSSGCPKSGFRGSGSRISAGFRISAHSPIEKPRSILLRLG